MMILTLLLALAPADDVKGEIRVVGGETLTVDLRRFREALTVEQMPAEPGGFTVNGTAAEKWTVELKDVKEGEITIAHKKLGIKLVLAVRPAEKRTCQARLAKVMEGEVAWIASCDTGDGKWETENDKGLPIATDGGISVNGAALADLKPLVRGSKSAFYLVSTTAFVPWIANAEKCYRAILDDDYKTFTSCFRKRDREMADRNDNCAMYWRAARKNVDVLKLKGYQYDAQDPKRSDDKTKTVMMRRVDKDGKQVGMRITMQLSLEDGAWVVIFFTP